MGEALPGTSRTNGAVLAASRHTPAPTRYAVYELKHDTVPLIPPFYGG